MVSINIDLVMITLAFLIGFINDQLSPQIYNYQGTKVVINKEYQCPTYCKTNHFHNVYFTSNTGMVVDKNKLGKKNKKK